MKKLFLLLMFSLKKAYCEVHKPVLLKVPLFVNSFVNTFCIGGPLI